MEDILARQRNVARPVTGKRFVLGVAGVIVRLALAQILVNLAIWFSGVGLLNIAFYLFAVWTLIRFMTRTVAGSAYTLKPSTLILQKTLGDSTTSVVEIPLESIVSVRPVRCGERLACSYRSVTVIDDAAATPPHMRLAFALALVSANLARRVAKGMEDRELACAVVFTEDGARKVCVFLPDEAFCTALAGVLPDVYGTDERTRENTPVTLSAQALARTFPALYPFVEPLVSQEREQAAREAIRQQHEAHRAKKQGAAAGKADSAPQSGEQNDIQDDTV